tara:strand:+ start:14954 stop:16513 length:1560 start_codon:yes stop_codon:yes gene_type:complete
MNGLGTYGNGGSTVEPTFTAFSGAIPRYFGRDAGTVEVTASGDFLPGSTHPAMTFGFAIGDLEGNDEVLVGTQPGTIFKFVDGFQGGQYHVAGKGYLEVGPGVGMYEALGDYDRPVLWNLEAKVCFMGRSSISPFKSSLSYRGDLVGDADGVAVSEPPDWGPQDAVFRSDADIEDGDVTSDDDNANVRIYGTLTVRDPFVTIDNNRSLSAWWGGTLPFGNSSTNVVPQSKTASMSGLDWGVFTDANATDYPSNLAKGRTVAHLGSSFESKGLVPGALWTSMTAGTADQKVDALVTATALQSIMEPGRGSQWQRWFRPRETVINFSMEEYVPDLNAEETQFLKLKVGGPMQSNPSSVYPDFAYPGTGNIVRFQSASYNTNPALAVPVPVAYLVLTQERADFLPDGDTYGDARELDSLCRRINPDGLSAADYVCRYPHTLLPAEGTAEGRLDSIAAVATTTNGNSKSYWYYTDPEGVGNAEGEWNCAWRRLADDRRDRMRIHHSTAFAFGGRPGTNDYRPV